MGELLLNLWLPQRKADAEASGTQTQIAWGEVYLKSHGADGSAFLGRTPVATFSRGCTQTDTDTDTDTDARAHTHTLQRTPAMHVKSAVSLSHFDFRPMFFKGSSEEEQVGSCVMETGNPSPRGDGVQENVSTIHVSFVPAETLDQVFLNLCVCWCVCASAQARSCSLSPISRARERASLRLHIKLEKYRETHTETHKKKNRTLPVCASLWLHIKRERDTHTLERHTREIDTHTLRHIILNATHDNKKEISQVCACIHTCPHASAERQREIKRKRCKLVYIYIWEASTASIFFPLISFYFLNNNK